jgi:hypothetical protein
MIRMLFGLFVLMLTFVPEAMAATFIPKAGNIARVDGWLDADRPAGKECVGFTMYGNRRGQSSHTFTGLTSVISPDLGGTFNAEKGTYCFPVPEGNLTVNLTLTVEGVVGVVPISIVKPVEFNGVSLAPLYSMMLARGSHLIASGILHVREGYTLTVFETAVPKGQLELHWVSVVHGSRIIATVALMDSATESSQ